MLCANINHQCDMTVCVVAVPAMLYGTYESPREVRRTHESACEVCRTHESPWEVCRTHESPWEVWRTHESPWEACRTHDLAWEVVCRTHESPWSRHGKYVEPTSRHPCIDYMACPGLFVLAAHHCHFLQGCFNFILLESILQNAVHVLT